MSLKSLKNPSGPTNTVPTFESLAQNVEQLMKQINRAESVVADLTTKPDIKIFPRLERTQTEIRTKLVNYTNTLNDLRRSDSNNPLDSSVSESLEQCRRKMEQIDRQVQNVSEIHRRMITEEKQREEQEQQALAQKSQEQIEADHVTNEINGLENAVQGIVEDLHELNDLTHQLDNKIQEQHEVIMKVDTVIESTVTEMQEGNKALEEAEEHQKGSNKCLIYILAIVLGVIALIVLGYFISK